VVKRLKAASVMLSPAGMILFNLHRPGL